MPPKKMTQKRSRYMTAITGKLLKGKRVYNTYSKFPQIINSTTQQISSVGGSSIP
jgi:hypothetical protein